MEEAMRKLDVYFSGLKTRCEQVPRFASLESPSYTAIAKASGVNYECFESRRCKSRVKLAIRELGLTPRRATEKEEAAVRFRHNNDLLEGYLNNLNQHGHKLPEHPRRKGELYLEQVQIEAGLNPSALILRRRQTAGNSIRLGKLLEHALPKVGMEVRVIPLPIGARESSHLTYEYLFAAGDKWRTAELVGDPSRQQLYNTRSALRYFMRHLELSDSDTVGEELGGRCEDALDKISAAITSPGTRMKFGTEIKRWSEYHKRLNGDPYPGSFKETLVKVIDESRLSLCIISAHLDINPGRLSLWCRGLGEPCALSFNVLSKIEELFRLPPGTLTDKIPSTVNSKRFRASQLPEVLRNDEGLRRRVTRYLPDGFAEATTEEQLKIIDSILATRYQSVDAYGKRLRELCKLPYLIKRWPEQLGGEIDWLFKIKTDEGPPIGMMRGGRWRLTTASKYRKDLASIFGSLVLPGEAEDPRVRGLGIDGGSLTIAMIVCPHLMHWYIKFYFEVRNKYTKRAFAILDFFKGLLAKKTGLLRQSPQLASRLTPVSCGPSALVTPDLIARAKRDWDGVCDDAFIYYAELGKSLRRNVARGRNTFAPISGILQMENPFEALRIMVDGIKAQMPTPAASPLHYHIAVRDLVLVFIFWLTGLRRHTVEQLDYGTDGGHLSLRSGRYVFDIPRAFFKDEFSSYFGPEDALEDYYCELPDTMGLNETFQEYLSVSRAWVLNQYHPNARESPLIVCGPNSKNARMPAHSISERYRILTGRHLVKDAYRGTGIDDVRCHGPHGTRHIRGTVVYRETGSFDLSGDANHNTGATAKINYAQSTPKTKSERINDILSSYLPAEESL